ncbi:hypothetical protein CLV62_1497 [Dysgonomonas alginatilytica]|uniref:Uncharacterized protein n=1 Tax=Dysgonomonas alginatilytica TaxID=1605892 RepID=A0A2V3PHF3_9BACT|nr:hypothetical protein [Dysgonomonas alginatilytica]PXV58398.1 hypothetical protein CLV62_1497 [Dysgonomonas alginatilytica]
MKIDLFPNELPDEGFTMEKLQQALDQIMDDKNGHSVPEFEGYCTSEMFKILHHPFDESSPVYLRKLSKDDYAQSPLYVQIRSLAEIIKREGSVKLTPNGYLPPKFVIELYNLGYFKEDNIEQGYVKLKRENDSDIISLAHYILVSSGVCLKRHGKLSLTLKGRKLLESDVNLFEHLFLFFVHRFNWSSFDNWGMEEVGQFGVGFSLILVNKYGDQNKTSRFYAEKYINAFPMLIDSFEVAVPGTLEGFLTHCYCLRTFDRFLNYWGLVNINKQGKAFDTVEYITKTPLFDKLVACIPPGK